MFKKTQKWVIEEFILKCSNQNEQSKKETNNNIYSYSGKRYNPIPKITIRNKFARYTKMLPTIMKSTVFFKFPVKAITKVYLRKTPLYEEADEIRYLATKSPESFTTSKEYYAPNYVSFLNPVFEKYGAISWIPNITLQSDVTTSFKIYDTYTKNITLYVEGITESGDLISEKKTIKVK